MNNSESLQQNPAWEAPKKPQFNPNEPYHFTSEEARVIRECNRESFYQRSLPIGTLLGLGTFYAVKSGYLKSSARWGASPKVFAAAVTGYFLGKFSYQSRCAEKMMQLPNSPLGEMLRRRRQQAGGASFTESFGLESSVMPSLPLPSTSESFEVYSDHGPRSMDLDITRPMQDNIDTAQRSNDAFLDEEPLPESKHNTTYEELRRQNRDEYDKKRITRTMPGIEEPPNVIRSRTAPSMGTTQSGEKNQYGDTWER